MSQNPFSKFVQIKTICPVCKKEKMRFTKKSILKKKDKPLGKQIEEKGYFELICDKCKEKTTK